MADETRVPARTHWLKQSERGSDRAIRVLLWMCRVFGRRSARWVLYPLAVYYAVFARGVRVASRDYLRRVFGVARFRDVVRHVRTFAECSLDRVFLLQRRYELFDIRRDGHQHLERLARERRGALLLGAHLGSFEALRAMSKAEQLPLSIVVHFENARRINGFLQHVDPQFMARVIAIEPNDPSYVFRIRDRIEAGEIVAILGDRTGLGERSVAVDFLGAKADFSTGAMALAITLNCPVLLTFGLYHAPRRYDLYCEPFFEPCEVPRHERDALASRYVARYASRLEFYCRMAPFNWFNFYDFWYDARA